MPVKRPILILAMLVILVCLCGCSVDPNANLSVGKTAHLGPADSGIDVTVLSVRQFEPDALKCAMEFVSTGGNSATVDPELVIKYDNRKQSAGFPVFTVRKDQKEFRTFDVDMNPEDIATIRSKGALVIFTYKGQDASWTVTAEDLAGNGQSAKQTTADEAQRKNDLSLQLLGQADFSLPLMYYQIDNSQRVGDEIRQYAYTETYSAAGSDNATPFSFQESLFRFPPGNASRMVDVYDSGLVTSMQRYTANGFTITLEKLPDPGIGDRGHAYRVKNMVYMNYLAFFSKGDTFCIISVVYPKDDGEVFFEEIVKKAGNKITA